MPLLGRCERQGESFEGAKETYLAPQIPAILNTGDKGCKQRYSLLCYGEREGSLQFFAVSQLLVQQNGITGLTFLWGK